MLKVISITFQNKSNQDTQQVFTKHFSFIHLTTDHKFWENYQKKSDQVMDEQHIASLGEAATLLILKQAFLVVDKPNFDQNSYST